MLSMPSWVYVRQVASLSVLWPVSSVIGGWVNVTSTIRTISWAWLREVGTEQGSHERQKDG
jgi:hypothetical protein